MKLKLPGHIIMGCLTEIHIERQTLSDPAPQNVEYYRITLRFNLLKEPIIRWIDIPINSHNRPRAIAYKLGCYLNLSPATIEDYLRNYLERDNTEE